MREAANFINALAEGRTLSDLRVAIVTEIAARRQEIDSLARELVESGLALWENAGEPYERLIVRGRSNLLDAGAEAPDVERIRHLFDDLERKRDIAEFLELDRSRAKACAFLSAPRTSFSHFRVPLWWSLPI